VQRILRLVLPLAVLVAAPTLAACGGGDDGGTSGKPVSESTDVSQVLDQTFTGKKDVKSGKLDVSVKADISGSDSGNGSYAIRLSGPFESQGTSKLPKFDMALEATGQGQDIKAGVTSTGDKGYVSFQGQAYSVPDNVFSQFRAGYEQAASQSRKKGSGQSLASLGVDPRKWLTNPQNAGEEQVGDTDTIKITGGVDVGKLLDDVNVLLSKAGSLGLQNQNVPDKLTAAQKREVEKALKDVKVEIYTGKDDSILRRMKVDLNAADPEGSNGKITLGLDVQLLDLNEGQDFEAPSDTKPLNDLLSQFGGLGALSGALGGASGSGSGSSGSGSSGGASKEQLKEYADCLEKAGQDVDAAQKCASLLNG
jgi:hypothetical protein